MVDKIVNFQNQVFTDIQHFIMQNIDDYPATVVKLASEKFQVTRQAIHKHMGPLIAQGFVLAEGKTNSRHYSLCELAEFRTKIEISPSVEEDQIWLKHIAPMFSRMPKNLTDICRYGFTEILNNAIDHSEAKICHVTACINAQRVWIIIHDHGVGIFKKIKRELQLEDEHQAILDLHKGKLTTDAKNHSGEGIFFTSRVFDQFNIFSYDLDFCGTRDEADWLIDSTPDSMVEGTMVVMKISTQAKHLLDDVFKKYTSDEDVPGFTKTLISIKLALYQSDGLVSRSQAKRILTRTDRFQEIVLDFNGIDTIGQAFADEIFRVFSNENPQISFIPINTSENVTRMINHVKNSGGNNL